MRVISAGAFPPLFSKPQCLTFNEKNTKHAKRQNIFTDNQEEKNRKEADVVNILNTINKFKIIKTHILMKV